MRGCAGRRRVVSRSPMTPHASSMSTRVEVAGVQPLEQHGEAGRVGPHEPHGAVAVPRLQGQGLGGRLAVRPGHLEHALAADPDGLAPRAEQAHRDDDGADAVQGPADRLELPLVEQAAEQGGQVVEPVLPRHPALRRVAGDLVREECRHEVVARGPLAGPCRSRARSPGRGRAAYPSRRRATARGRSTGRCRRARARRASGRRRRRWRRPPCRAGASRGAGPLPGS